MNPENKQRFYLVFIMALVALGVYVLSNYVLYEAIIEDKKADLINIAKSRARVIESVARFDLEQSSDFPGGNIEATLSQFREAHKNFVGFGKTGEFTLARLDGDQIVFLLRQRHSHFPIPTPIPLNTELAEPMRKALNGESGVIIGIDYRGEKVLAAYEPVNVLKLGLVVKMDLAEIHAPFIKAGLIAGAAGLFIIIFGSFVFFRVSNTLLQTIKRSEDRFRTMFDEAPLGYALIDSLTGYIYEANAKYAEMTGRSIEEIKNLDWMSITHPDDIQADLDNMADMNAGNTTGFSMDKRYVKPDDSIVWVHMTIAPLTVEGKKLPRHLCMVEDITERKETEQKLNKLSQVIQQIPISVLITDQDGNIEYVNNALTDLTGYTEKEVLGQKPSLFKSGETADEHYKFLWKIINKGKEWRGVFHNKKKNGDLFWESVLIFSLKNEQGKITNYIGLKENISQKKRMESTLIDHERLIRSVINNLNDGLIIANRDGTIQLFNKGAEKIFGYGAEEVLDSPIAVLMDETSKAKHDAGFARFRKTQKISPNNTLVEVVGTKKDGSPVPIELTLTQMEQRGEVLVIGLVRDISERKEAENRMKMAQNQITASQKLAEIGELTAGVSHEVLNPVNIISVHTQMLQRKTLSDPNIQEYCSKVRHEIVRITKIMSSLLDFSRKGDATLQKGYLREEIEKTIALVQTDYKLDNIEIVSHWCDALLNLQYDPDKMRQIYLNLLQNAKQAMPDGGTITIGCNSIKGPHKNFHQFTFSDTGMGMSEETQLKIFNPFFTTKPEGQGTGLGLSVVFGIIQEHGGTITVQSKEGKGTTFTINLPLA